MTGHKATVHTLAFSNDGRFLVSSGSDAKILIWDMANGGLVTILGLHTECVYTLAFSREGTLLASGGLDYAIRLWDFNKLIEDVISEEGGATISPDSKKISGDHSLVGAYHTKQTSVFGLHFTRRNILLASGPYQSS
jgi:transcription initiation factor TFIID subunit 5